MKLRIALLAATVLVAPFAVHAQPVSGLYIAGGAGANLLQDTTVKHISPNVSSTVRGNSNFRYDVGPVVVGSIGYGLGNGLRFELEGTGMQNKVNKFKSAVPSTAGGDQYKYGVFANALYDLPINSAGRAVCRWRRGLPAQRQRQRAHLGAEPVFLQQWREQQPRRTGDRWCVLPAVSVSSPACR